MTDKLITSLSSCFLSRGWICTEDIPSFRYVLECFIGRITFLSLLALVCIILHCYEEALSFSVVLLIFRRRMGGWHARSRWLCQMLSIGSVILVSCLLGPLLSKAPFWITISANILLILTSFLLSPVYPPQMHFSAEEKTGNIRKKNQFLLILLILQFPLVKLFNYEILSYINLGLCFGMTSLFIEYISNLNRKDNNHEEAGQVRQKSH